MGLKFFVVPAMHPDEAEAEMNAFLRGHRVVSLKRELVMNEGCPVWCVSAEYVESPAQTKRGVVRVPAWRCVVRLSLVLVRMRARVRVGRRWHDGVAEREGRREHPVVVDELDERVRYQRAEALG